MINVLLTGAGGFLGKTISNTLERKGFGVFGSEIFGKNKIDITNAFDLDPKLEATVIIHAAGKAHVVPKTKQQADAFYDVNFHGTKNLTGAIDKLAFKPKYFVFISTVSVYGLDSGTDISEDHPLNGITPYAKSKILAEEFLVQWCDKNDVKLTILRLPLIAGVNPPGNLGAMIRGIKSGLYFSIGKGEARKSMVWAEDVAAAIPKVMKLGGIYNLTDGIHPSFNELEAVFSNSLNKRKPMAISMTLAKILARVGDLIGNKIPINSDKLEKMTSTLTFSDQKARTGFGWDPSNVSSKLGGISY